MKEIRNGFGMNRFQIATIILSVGFISWVTIGSWSSLEELKNEGAPADFIEVHHEELGWLVFFMLVPSTLVFYAAGFVGKKYIKDQEESQSVF